MIYLPLTLPPLGLLWEINRDSPQSKGLIEWAPAARDPRGPSPATGSRIVVESVSSLVADPTMGIAVSTPGTNVEPVAAGIYTTADRMAGLVNFSLSFWVYYVSGTGIWSNGVFAATQSFIDSAGTGTWRVGFRRPDTSLEPSTITSPLVANQWVHVCLTRAGTSGVQYKNGAQHVAWGSAGLAIPATGGGLSLGQSRRGTGGGSATMVGRVADLRLYNRALSAAEVWALWNPATRWGLYGVRAPRGRGAAFFATMMQHHHAMLAGGRR